MDERTMCAAAERYIDSYLAALGDKISDREMAAGLRGFMKADVVFHADGIRQHDDVVGIPAFCESVKAERTAYRLLDFNPAVFAANGQEGSCFVMSLWRVESVGAWMGQPASGRKSEGMRVDELRFGVDGKVAAVWVRRQLTHEEREALLQRPDDPDHVPDRFDVGKLRTYGPDDVHLARHSPASRMHAMLTWILAWQEDSEGARLWPPVAGEASDVSSGLGTAAAAAAGDLHTLPQAAAAPPPAGEAADMATQQQQQQHQRHRLRRFEGGYNVEALDSVLDSAFTVHDVLGVRGRPHYPHGGALHHYQRIASRQDAKIGLKELSARYLVRESLVSHAAPPGANVCFAHWRARLEARPPPPFELVPPPAAPGPPPAGLVPLDVAPAGVSGVVLESPPAASQGAAVQPVDITPTAQTYYVEAVDVAFYSDAGLISDVYQFRTPVGWERRHVLD